MPRTEPESDCIVMIAELLAERVETRFPDRGLRKVAWRVRNAAAEAVNLPEMVQKPIRWIRMTSWAIVALIALIALIALVALIALIVPAFAYLMILSIVRLGLTIDLLGKKWFISQYRGEVMVFVGCLLSP